MLPSLQARLHVSAWWSVQGVALVYVLTSVWASMLASVLEVVFVSSLRSTLASALSSVQTSVLASLEASLLVRPAGRRAVRGLQHHQVPIRLWHLRVAELHELRHLLICLRAWVLEAMRMWRLTYMEAPVLAPVLS